MLGDSDMEPPVENFKFYIEAFRELSSCRVNTMAVGPIPFTAIVEYYKVFGIEDFEDFHYYIRLMDDKFVRLDAEKTATKMKGST